jgi:hypothetical protein
MIYRETKGSPLTHQEVDNNFKEMSAISSGLQGVIIHTSPAPTEDGYYRCNVTGTYTNFGNIVVDLSQGITDIFVSDSQTTFTKNVTPIDVTLTGEVESGETEAVEGGKIYTAIETASNNKVVMGTKPLTSTSSGLAGQIAYDTAISDFESRVVADGGVVESLECIPFIDNYLFVCIASNVWKRIPMESW